MRFNTAMEIILTPALNQLIRSKVESGLYRDEAEVVGEALRQMEEREAGLEWVRNAAAAGFDQLDRGEFVEFTRDELLAHLGKPRRA
jgi:antitoxin ParD1/3/4